MRSRYSFRIGFGRGPSPSASLVLAVLLAAVGQAAAAGVTGTVTVVDASGPRASAAGVVVWLEGGPSAPGRPAGAGGPYQMRSQNKQFTPRVLAVPVGTEVDFPNADPIFHNVFSVSKTKPFDLGLYKSGKSSAVTFDAAGLVRVYCNIHPTMVGFIHVFAVPHFALVGDDGRFQLSGVAPGRYALKAWDERGGIVSTALTVVAGETAAAKVELNAAGFKDKPHLNKYGRPYDAKSSGERY